MKPIQQLVAETNYWGWVPIPDGYLYLGGNDCGVALRAFHHIDYEVESLKLWRELCAGAKLVIDVGAHTGCYTLAALKAKTQVISLEPYAVNYARLMLNVRYSGFLTHGLLHNIAASDQNGVGFLNVNTPPFYCSTGGHMDESGIPVRMVKLDSLLLERMHKDVKAVKIDVEGHGLKVLDGMKGILSAARPTLIIEDQPGLAEKLDSLGYESRLIEDDEARNRYATPRT